MGGSAGCVLQRWRWSACSVAVALLLLVGMAPGTGATQPHPVDPVVVRAVPLGNAAWGMMAVPGPPGDHQRPPGVLLFGDGDSAFDGRTELYAQRLLSLGFGLLDADFDGLLADEGTPAHPPVTPIGARLGLALAALDANVPLDLGRLGAIGIGVGARALLEGWAGNAGTLRAAVLLYPVCDDALLARASALRPQADRGRLLLVHGDADPAEAAGCAALAERLGGATAGITRYVLRGADVGWDLDAGDPERRFSIRDPAEPGRRRLVQPDPERAAIALDQILLFLMRALEPAGLSLSECRCR
jgi:dienelactone hydrolase